MTDEMRLNESESAMIFLQTAIFGRLIYWSISNSNFHSIIYETYKQ